MNSREYNLEALRRLLMQGPTDSTTAAQALQISQPTFSRLWQDMDGGLAFGAARARKYALRRRISGVDAPIPVYRIAPQGRAEQIGQLDALYGGWYSLSQPGHTDYTLFQGLPFFLSDLRPQGFLGRMEPLKNRDLELPENILLWTDEQVLKYLARRGEHVAGNLILGNESYARLLDSSRSLGNTAIAARAREASYPHCAENAMRGDTPGSSAGGEQPKFTHIVQRTDETSRVEHVIVKFSPRMDSESGRRWADLLICEHLALQTLQQHGIAAASTSILESEQRIFLEVVRFDRIGANGRLPMVTLAGLDGELGMLDQSWTAVARELVRQRRLSVADQQTIEILDLYGALIANTDKHHGNLAVSWAFGQPCQLLPAYDMLPMHYRPSAHGEIVERDWSAQFINRLELRHLPLCYRLAHIFWQSVLADTRISEQFKQVAARHLAAIAHLDPGQAAPASGAPGD